MLKPAVLARTGHRWLGLLVGIQVAVWLATGLYMVIVDIDFIHGDTLVVITSYSIHYTKLYEKVGGAVAGTINAFQMHDGDVYGRISFRDPAASGIAPLDFEPRGQQIEVLQA